MLEISGKVQWSILFLHHKTAIFIFTHTVRHIMMDCQAHVRHIMMDCQAF